MHAHRPRRRSPKPIAPPRALLIDGMGTLLELEPPAPALRRELAERFGLDLPPAVAERALAAEIRHYRAHMVQGRDAASLGALRRDCAAVLRDALIAGGEPRARTLHPAPLTDALLAALRFRAHADVRPALARARAAGARVLVVSNWDVSLIDVLQRVGLAPLLWGVVTSAAVGAGKPAPAIFRYALHLAGVAPGDALHVGDSLAEDVRGAQACGIRAVLLCRPGSEPPVVPGDVPRIASLAELNWPQLDGP